MAKEIYNYYPNGDKDPQSRQMRVDLIFEEGEWRKLGQGTVSPEELMQMRDNVVNGWADIIKKNEAQQVMPGEGKADFLKSVPAPSKRRHRER